MVATVTMVILVMIVVMIDGDFQLNVFSFVWSGLWSLSVNPSFLLCCIPPNRITTHRHPQKTLEQRLDKTVFATAVLSSDRFGSEMAADRCRHQSRQCLAGGPF